MVTQFTYGVVVTVTLLWNSNVVHGSPKGILYPKESETREQRTLDGIWNFRLSPNYKDESHNDDLSKTGPVIPMPVPASYNDITEEASIRDHVGLVWYDRRFYVPDAWRKAEYCVWLRFSGVHYAARVWVNGNAVKFYQSSHQPFEAEVKQYLNFDSDNLIIVACDNTLSRDTVPQGKTWELTSDNQTRYKQSYNFDIFNYAGIHRSVFLYTTSYRYIDDIWVETNKQGKKGIVIYKVSIAGSRCPSHVTCSSEYCNIELLDRNNTVVNGADNCAGTLNVADAHFWWPYLMSPDPGYLYTLKVTIFTKSGKRLDVYRQKVGIRALSWNDTSVKINDEPIYMRGFGMHEDSDVMYIYKYRLLFYDPAKFIEIRGKGLDLSLLVKDFELIRWMGANTFHTSHYPFAEEVYDMADELGIMIIDACAIVNTNIYEDKLLSNHKTSMANLIIRDKNHPSVIMWSIAIEPQKTQSSKVDEYFETLTRSIRNVDPTRPITITLATEEFREDKAAKHVDVISISRYQGWYSENGDTSNIKRTIIAEIRTWNSYYKKPVIMSAYGADAIAGLHLYPEYVWSEEYQVMLMSEHFRAFDKLIYGHSLIGEFISHFADFKTSQKITKVGGDMQGIFTRERQPKAAAHHLRQRYHQLANFLNNVTLPEDIKDYVCDGDFM